nr:MAG TPA: hypothetical protein [Caudoviricetes sp.]
MNLFLKTTIAILSFLVLSTLLKTFNLLDYVYNVLIL